MKFYAKWRWIEYEREINYSWFETLEEVEAWETEMLKGNGYYFEVLKIAEGNYNKYLEMIEIEKKLKELKALF